MISTLIFSRDRASQLLSLLQSVDQYIPHDIFDFTILYSATK